MKKFSLRMSSRGNGRSDAMITNANAFALLGKKTKGKSLGAKSGIETKGCGG